MQKLKEFCHSACILAMEKTAEGQEKREKRQTLRDS
jgi:hypothetical protein